MSEHTPDITTGFIQMVEAFKAKPELEAKIAELEAKLREAADHIGDLNNEVINTKSDLRTLSSDKERLTRERDEAMFRTLELEEKTSAVNDLLAQLTRVVHPEPVATDTHEDKGGVGSKDSMSEGQDQHRGPVEDQYHNRDGSHPENRAQAYDGGFQGLPPSSNVENFPRPEYSGQGKEHEPNAEQRSTVERQYPNWDTPAKSEQNSSETSGSASEPMASSDVKDEPVAERRPNEGKPYSDKPYWVSDANWRAEGGQGPYDGGSWTAPWADRYGS